MRWFINYIRQCFCKHDWELIYNTDVDEVWGGRTVSTYTVKTYRCVKCGYARKYKSH